MARALPELCRGDESEHSQISDVRMSLQTLRVLEAFLENPSDQLSGADVQKRSRMASGTLYRLSADPTIARSSGSARLDEGAVRLAKAGSGHYRATTEDGRPVSSCFPFLIRFDFRD